MTSRNRERLRFWGGLTAAVVLVILVDWVIAGYVLGGGL